MSTPNKPAATVNAAQADASADMVKMQRQIEDLQRALEAEKLKNSVNPVDAGNLFTLAHTASTERRSKNVDGTPKFEEITYHDAKGNVIRTEKVEVWDYKIDLGPSGDYMTVGGIQYLHGTTYQVNTHTLRSLKEISYRTWEHEADIHGRNQNEYRRQLSPTVR